MPVQKELNFFIDEYTGPPIQPPEERNWDRGSGWYERQFSGALGEQAVGEASVNYTRHPTYPGVAERVAAVLPSVRLVYVLRHPVDRVVSHYLHDRAKGRERSPIDVAVRRDERYLAPSRYATQLEQYLRFFPAGQLLVLRSDDLLARRLETVRRVLDFIGVSSDIELNVDFEAHRSSEKIERNRALALAKRVPYRGVIPRPVRRRVRRIVARPLDTSSSQLDKNTHDFLTAQLAPEVRRLSDLTGENFGKIWGMDSQPLT
jgi:hypothetical protein